MPTHTLPGWNSALSVGIESLDAQHQRLVEMIHALEEARGNHQADEVLRHMFEGVISSFQDHFECEERLLARHAYPELESHRCEHAEFLSRVRRLNPADGSAPAVMLSAEIVDFVSRWFSQHLANADRAYASHLTPRGAGPS